MKFLQPYTPTPDDPWNHAKASHLARRAGFGATPNRLEDMVALGVEGAVGELIAGPADESPFEQALERAGATQARDGRNVDALRREWFFRMVHGPDPLREKLVLFWHDHFATQESKVIRAPLIYDQLATLRRHAMGRFPDLISAIAKDPAMLVLLDNRLSDAANPNENWARELLELYTLGVDHYTQGDVVELARIFTGWTTPEAHVPEFQFRPEMHDSGDKVLFGSELVGRSGADGMAEGIEALARIVARADCPRFLADKLCRWFVSHEPDPLGVAEVAEVLRRNGLDLAATLSQLFRSRWFYAPSQRFALYKNPVELAVSTLRLLEVQNAHLAGLERLTRSMGMQLYEAPSVAGWEHGEGWVDSGAVVQRFHFALEVSDLPHSTRNVVGRPATNLDQLAGGDDPDPHELVERLSLRLLQRPLDEWRHSVLVTYLEEADLRAEADESVARRRRRRTRALVHLLLTTPEYAVA